MMTEREKYDLWCEFRPGFIAEANTIVENKLEPELDSLNHAISDLKTQIATVADAVDSWRVNFEAFGANVVDAMCRLFQERFDQEDFHISEDEYLRVLLDARMKTMNETGRTLF